MVICFEEQGSRFFYVCIPYILKNISYLNITIVFIKYRLAKSSSEYFPASNSAKKGSTIDRAARKSYFEPKVDDSTGPHDYTPKSTFNHNKTYSMGMRRNSSSGNVAPGPGAYSRPDSSTFTAHK